MKRYGAISALLLCGLMGGPAAAQVSGSAGVECDRLAASPVDRTRPSDAPGIAFDAIDASAAVAACTRAVSERPNDSRLKFQLARALQKAGAAPDRQVALNREAADGGHIVATHNLAVIYESGRIVPEDQAEAVRLFRKSAEAGLVISMVPLARHLNTGRGTTKDTAEALSWFRRSADAGDAIAREIMGSSYADGDVGLSRDDAEARRWFQAAAEVGSSPAKRLLDGLKGLDALDSDAVRGRQRQLADARCYTGPIDGRATASLQRSIVRCPTQDPILRVETGMHIARIWRADVDARCQIVVTGSEDKTVRLWSMPGGRLLRTQHLPIGPGNSGKIYAVAMSPDGKWAAAGGWDTSWDAFAANSIYLFDTATGQTLRRLGNYGGVINHLAFSLDGTRLAVALSGGLGVRVLDVASGRETGADRDFGGRSSNGVTFLADGSVAAVGYDGVLRRMTADGRRLAQVPTRGGKEPLSVAADPAGRLLAVGYVDTPAVDLYDAADLSFRGAADSSDVTVGANFGRVAWSGNGQRLYAGGRYAVGSARKVRVFSADGKRVGPDLSVGDNTLSSLAPCGDAMMFAAQDPSFGLIAPNGAVTTLARSHGPDMRNKKRDSFTVSADGSRVRFGLGVGSTNPILADLSAGTLSESRVAPVDLRGPDINGLPVTDWENQMVPRLAGKTLVLPDRESSRALAVRPDRTGFVLGTDFSVRAFDATGKPLWSKPVPSTTWGITLTRGGEMVVSAYDDGTVRWLRWRDGQELLALFVNKDTRAWVAWTPTGYYAASPGAEDMIGWHINRGWEQPADFFPASKFSDTFARPDIVERVLSTMDEAEAIRQANLSRPDRRGPVKAVTDILPPVVSILSPAEGSLASGEEVRIDYLVRSPSGLPVDGVEAVINGRPAGGERGLGRPGAGADGSGSVGACLRDTGGLGRSEGGLQGCRGSLSLRLPPGTSEVGLFARAGERAGDVVKVRVARAAAARGEELLKPKLYALVVGVSQYRNPDYALQFAAKDARDFSAALGNQKGGLYSDVTLKLVTDGDATRTGILDGLDWLTKEVTSRDVGLVYFAGHGVLDESNRFYLAAADTDMNRLRVTGVPRDDIQAALDVVAGKALLFLDACHSGAVAGRRGAVDINSVVNEFTRTERGVVMFTASTGKQVSQENAAWGNGAFTKAVIEGLGGPGMPGKADMLGTGKISASALDVYVSERVKQLTDGRQSPVMIRPSTVPDFTLAVVR